MVSQGRVEAIVLSRPRERRLLIEEAAGLGKHRKRRRRAQLKLERTEENLSRALDVEREARSRLRPLKRQAEAAELHERLERQTLEARCELARDAARSARLALAEAEERAPARRAASATRPSALLGGWPSAASRPRRRSRRSRANARSCRPGCSPRARRASGSASAWSACRTRRGPPPTARSGAPPSSSCWSSEPRRRRPTTADGAAGRPHRRARARAGGPRRRARGAAARRAGRPRGRASCRRRRGECELERAAAERPAPRSRRPSAPADSARAARRDAERALEAARAAAARAGAELAAVNQFLRAAAGRRTGVRRSPSRWTSSPATSWRWPPRSARASARGGGRASPRASAARRGGRATAAAR